MEITIKNKISEQFDNHDYQSFITLSVRFCFVVSIVCMLNSLGYAETLSDNIDPIGILDSSSPSSQDVNIPNIFEQPENSFRIQQPDIRIAELPSERWLTEINNNAAVNFTAMLDKKTSDLPIAKSPVTGMNRQRWQAEISISESNERNQNKNELQQVIQQVSSVEFKEPAPPSKPIIDVAPAGNVEPNEALSGSGRQNEKQLLDGQITKQTMKIFEQLSQKPQQIKCPFELAEILFRSGQLKEAAKCYQEALNRKTENENGLNLDKAWVLFQIGNCLQKDDPSTATKIYIQLIEQYPGSPWVESAKAKSKLIDWYLRDKPNTLINEKK
jgi:tetratricopeptide (TPR) repeat protein